jgi:hypothetical protein
MTIPKRREMNCIERTLPTLLAILGLTLAVSSPALADATFYLNTDETAGSPPANTIEVDLSLISSTSAAVTVTNLDPSDISYDLHNVFLNVSGLSMLGACTQLESCSAITGTGTGNGPYYYVSNQSGGFGVMTYNIDDTGTAATSITVDLTASGGNSWTSANSVLTPNSAGYEASVELLTQSGYQAAGSLSSVPEPSAMLLLGAGLLALVPLRAFKDKAQRPRLP